MTVAKFLAKKGAFFAITFLVATFMVVVISNLGGLIDGILVKQIEFEVSQQLNNDPEFLELQRKDPEAADEEYWRQVNMRKQARGLDQPTPIKWLHQTVDALTLNLGRASQLTSASGSSVLWVMIMERLPRTALLFTTATALSAVIGIWLGLRMARRALSVMDRSLTVVSITTLVIPSWVFAILFLLLFSFSLRIFPSGGMFSAPAPTDPLARALDFTWHLTLPVITVTFAGFGGWSYITRNLVMQIMDEDFVTVARTKGLPEKTVLNRYVLRAASPPIVTSLALALITSWTGAIVTEIVFNWPGLGRLYWDAIQIIDAPVIIALTIIYAFLFVITIFLLDVAYSFLDPRIKALGRA